MIEVKSQEDWLKIADKLDKTLRQKGWKPGSIYSTSKVKNARADKMQCWKYGKKFKRTHADFHSYLIDHKARVCYSHRDKESYPFQRWNGEMHLELFKFCKRT